MAIELHVKRIHTDSYDHLDKIRIRRCPIRVGILDIHIARKITAFLKRAVYQSSALGAMHAKGLCPLYVIRANQFPR
jgi:hypothetical protein